MLVYEGNGILHIGITQMGGLLGNIKVDRLFIIRVRQVMQQAVLPRRRLLSQRKGGTLEVREGNFLERPRDPAQPYFGHYLFKCRLQVPVYRQVVVGQEGKLGTLKTQFKPRGEPTYYVLSIGELRLTQQPGECPSLDRGRETISPEARWTCPGTDCLEATFLYHGSFGAGCASLSGQDTSHLRPGA